MPGARIRHTELDDQWPRPSAPTALPSTRPQGLANPVRRKIVTSLLNHSRQWRRDVRSVTVLVSMSTLTRDLQVLSKSGILKTIDFGSRVFVELWSTEIE